jgi:hypothetical protein
LVLKSRKVHGTGREVIYSVLIIRKLKPVWGQFQYRLNQRKKEQQKQ